jgi:hypothetical protein
MCGSNAAKERLKRLKEGRHPYRSYAYFIDLVGPVGDGWAARECPPEPPGCCGVVGGKQDGPLCEEVSMVLGQVVSAREHADLLTFLRYEEALEAFTLGTGMDVGRVDGGPVFEGEDPFNHAGLDFDFA